MFLFRRESCKRPEGTGSTNETAEMRSVQCSCKARLLYPIKIHARLCWISCRCLTNTYLSKYGSEYRLLKNERFQMNSTLQAKLHYDGKPHQKKVSMFLNQSVKKQKTEDGQVSSTTTDWQNYCDVSRWKVHRRWWNGIAGKSRLNAVTRAKRVWFADL